VLAVRWSALLGKTTLIDGDVMTDRQLKKAGKIYALSQAALGDAGGADTADDIKMRIFSSEWATKELEKMGYTPMNSADDCLKAVA